MGTERPPDHKLKMSILVAAVLLVIGLAAFGSLVLISRSIDSNNRKWCTTLQLLTATPVPSPSAGNPSRAVNYRLYRDFVDLQNQFGCGISSGNS